MLIQKPNPGKVLRNEFISNVATLINDTEMKAEQLVSTLIENGYISYEKKSDVNQEVALISATSLGYNFNQQLTSFEKNQNIAYIIPKSMELTKAIEENEMFLYKLIGVSMVMVDLPDKKYNWCRITFNIESKVAGAGMSKSAYQYLDSTFQLNRRKLKPYEQNLLFEVYKVVEYVRKSMPEVNFVFEWDEEDTKKSEGHISSSSSKVNA